MEKDLWKHEEENRLLQFLRDDRSLQKWLWKSAAMLPHVEGLRKARQVFTSELALH